MSSPRDRWKQLRLAVERFHQDHVCSWVCIQGSVACDKAQAMVLGGDRLCGTDHTSAAF